MWTNIIWPNYYKYGYNANPVKRNLGGDFNLKLFIIEDDIVLRTELISLLESYNYSCETSDNFKNIISEATDSYKGITLSVAKSTVYYESKEAELTKNELRILSVLMQNSNSIISRDDLMDELWQSDEFVDDNTLTVNVNRLRKKLEEIGAADLIKTKRGQGYMI